MIFLKKKAIVERVEGTEVHLHPTNLNSDECLQLKKYEPHSHQMDLPAKRKRKKQL
jgi:hypothetical protein